MQLIRLRKAAGIAFNCVNGSPRLHIRYIQPTLLVGTGGSHVFLNVSRQAATRPSVQIMTAGWWKSKVWQLRGILGWPCHTSEVWESLRHVPVTQPCHTFRAWI